MSDKKSSKKRCCNCNTLLIKGTIVKGIAELKCDVCGETTIIRENGESYNAIKAIKAGFRPLAFG
jgi:hypothetical protein